MLTGKQVAELGEAFRQVPMTAMAALSLFLRDVTETATEQALELELERDRRDLMTGYAKGLRDVQARIHDLHSGAYKQWPEYRAWVEERKKDAEVGEGESEE